LSTAFFAQPDGFIALKRVRNDANKLN